MVGSDKEAAPATLAAITGTASQEGSLAVFVVWPIQREDHEEPIIQTRQDLEHKEAI